MTAPAGWRPMSTAPRDGTLAELAAADAKPSQVFPTIARWSAQQNTWVSPLWCAPLSGEWSAWRPLGDPTPAPSTDLPTGEDNPHD